ncbi:diacylglycerol kinase [Rhodobacteraceae bacterium W635]|uniref:c-type cytochrome n=1 Tax=Nioella halotolerans TaxID=2303578 RepID=UPI000E3BC7E6|nr:diacylglycerol kinase [Rhodobacteraceae bacterium W635]
MRFLRIVLALAVIGVGAGLWLTAPQVIEAADLPDHDPDPAHGEQVFIAAGCASCHAAEEAEGEARLILSGGRAFASDFGTFYAPNVSMNSEHGIGDWSEAEFLTAIRHGVSPGGQHYYPAFPYTTYARAGIADLRDLWAYMQTLPADATPSRAHDVGFPFSIRRALGGWKLLFSDDDWVMQGADLSPQVMRGRYLVEALGHCGECHTPRNALGALDHGNWLSGAPNPSGDGRIPGITPDALGWSADDIANYLNDGFTPEFDSAGGSMVEVIANTSQLPAEDRTAIAAYLRALPASE